MDRKDMTDDEADLTAELDSLGRIHARAASASPPRELDAVILARSRAALAAARLPRRWWIPASVAATALIAFSLVTRVQQEAGSRPAATDVATIQRPAAVRNSGSTSATATEPRAAALAEAPPVQPVPTAEADAHAGKRSVPPRQSMPRETTRQTSAPAPLADTPAAAPVATPRKDLAPVATAAEKAGRIAPPITPEAWLKKIEALEEAGRTEEAARERVSLEKAYPGWLEGRQGPH
jgi:hypothetical protein